MKENYDFSNAERGKFYRPYQNFNITIKYEAIKDPAKFEIYKSRDHLFHFRLVSSTGNVLYESEGCNTKEDCLNAVQDYQRLIISASIVSI